MTSRERLDQGAIEEAFCAMVEQYSDLAYNVAYRMLRNVADAEDAVQEALVSAYRAFPSFKKPVLASMPVLDVNRLSTAQLGDLAQAYDHLCSQELLPFPYMDGDPVRRQIDEVISQALGLPDISVLRGLLEREPVVCLRPLP